MSAKYFFTVKGARQGPTTLDELKSLAAREELKRSDLVWTEGMAAWQPAGSTGDIFQGLPPDLESATRPSDPPPLPSAATTPSLPETKSPPKEHASFIEWYLYALKNYTVFVGRARRKEFWSFYLVNTSVSFLLKLIPVVFGGEIDGIQELCGGISIVYFLCVIVPSVGVCIRRLHDTDRSGWWTLVPLVNLICCAEDSKPGSNRFGPNPKTSTP